MGRNARVATRRGTEVAAHQTIKGERGDVAKMTRRSALIEIGRHSHASEEKRAATRNTRSNKCQNALDQEPRDQSVDKVDQGSNGNSASCWRGRGRARW